MNINHIRYHKIIKLKCSNYKFKFVKELSELLELILQHKKHTIKALKAVSHATVLDWIIDLSNLDLEEFMIDVFVVDLMEIFAELCHKLFSGVF